MRILYISITIVFALFLFASCGPKAPSAQEIVDKAIVTHGGENFNKAIVTFKFRDYLYRALRDNGAYVYSRTFTDSTGQRVYDVLQNSGFTRTINDQKTDLPADKVKAYSNSVNGVIYFALLPYFLNDDAVQKEYLGEVTIKGESYYKIKVTFAQQGGGEDHEDEYVYWFHQKNYTMDYLAYSFLVDGGGTRFREAVNPRKVGGILFQDYVNYAAEAKDFNIENYDRAFEAGKLEKISDINLEEIEVKTIE
jgi:hypothetical protein